MIFEPFLINGGLLSSLPNLVVGYCPVGYCPWAIVLLSYCPSGLLSVLGSYWLLSNTSFRLIILFMVSNILDFVKHDSQAIDTFTEWAWRARK